MTNTTKYLLKELHIFFLFQLLLIERSSVYYKIHRHTGNILTQLVLPLRWGGNNMQQHPHYLDPWVLAILIPTVRHTAILRQFRWLVVMYWCARGSSSQYRDITYILTIGLLYWPAHVTVLLFVPPS